MRSNVKARHDKMVELVERMLDLHKQLPKAKTPRVRRLFIDGNDGTQPRMPLVTLLP